MRWIGHAGLAGTRPAGAPDRVTLARAAALGLDRLELDVACCAGGAMLLLHDVRLADGRAVADLDLAALRRSLPELLTLDEGVEAIGPDLPLLLDLKGAAVVEPLARWLRARRDASRLALCDEDPIALAALRAAAPAVARWRTLPVVGAGPGERRRRYLAVVLRARLASRAAALAAEVGATALSVDRWAVTAGLCANAHRHGLEVAAWTVNRHRVAQLMARRGVDFLTSDAVDRLRESSRTGGQGRPG